LKGGVKVNKTKRVAWRKHRIKAKKMKEKRLLAQKASGSVATATTTRR
jgi:hypothetical protein